jgi:orotate phosphoribosyltransferase
VSVVDELGLRLLDVALLEGDFTLRSGKRSRWYLDKYRFETDPALLRELGERLAAAAACGSRCRPRRSSRVGWSSPSAAGLVD